VLATVTGPIVTDYVPAAKPPWLVLAVLAILIFAFIPRESLGIALLALGVLSVFMMLIVRRYSRIQTEQQA
jgi:hypothetical protein